jgi:protein-tyrosine phosphatase
MDTANRRDLLRLAETDAEREKVRLILDYVAPGEDRSVPDPYWDDDGFERVYRMLDEACDRLLDAHAPAG